MNNNLSLLESYPFEKLKSLFSDVIVNESYEKILLSIGEPKHEVSQFIKDELVNNINTINVYPLTKGIDELRESIAKWLTKRYKLTSISSTNNILPVNGTREAIFSFVQAAVTDSDNTNVVMPNPFYQIYEGATLLAGAKTVLVNATKESNFLPDFTTVSDNIWQNTTLVLLCSPSNPTGAVHTTQELKYIINKSIEFDFIVASDECYSELYYHEDKPPVGLLEVASSMGINDYKNCIVFHSLSKRSNVPGMRSGFIAGDATILEQYFSYRTYHGCAMPLHHQKASTKAWQDEAHVINNRELYREKFDKVATILATKFDVRIPEAGFYLWLKTPIDDQEFAKILYSYNITVLPGSFLSRDNNGINPGAGYVRMELVAPLEQCVNAANRIIKINLY